MVRRLWLLLALGQPGGLLLLVLMTVAGATLSPHFLSPDFPLTGVSKVLGERIFRPPVWSLVYAGGGGVITAMLWLGASLIRTMSVQLQDPAALYQEKEVGETPGPARLLRWALWLQCAASLLVLAAGSRPALLLCLMGAALGNACSLPPLRLAESGLPRYFVAGGGIVLAMTGGMLGQGRITQVGLLTALALGLLAAATVVIMDFRDAAEGRRLGRTALPRLLGPRTAVRAQMAALTVAYLAAAFLLMQTIGIRRQVLAGLLGLMAAHLGLIAVLLVRPGEGYIRTAERWSIVIYVGVAALYVGAQAVY